MTGMNLSVREINDGALFEIAGRLMHESDSHLFHDKLNEELKKGKKWFVLDLSGVIGLSSTGLGILIAAHRTIQDCGGSFRLAQLSDKVRTILQITRLNGIFEIFDNVEEAVKQSKKTVVQIQ